MAVWMGKAPQPSTRGMILFLLMMKIERPVIAKAPNRSDIVLASLQLN